MKSEAIEFPFPLDFLESISLSNVVDEMTEQYRIVEIQDSDTVSTALDLMYKNGVYSLVLFKQSNEKEYLCFITMSDIVSWLVFQQTPDLETKIGLLQGQTAESRSLLVFSFDQTLPRVLMEMRIGVHHCLVMAAGQEKPFIPVQSMTKGVRVVSQSDILQFLGGRLKSLGPILETRAESLMQLSFKYLADPDPNQPAHLPGSRWSGSKMKYAIHQSERQTAFQCFKQMATHKLSGIAIVNGSQELVESLSMTDFSLIAEKNLSFLEKPVSEYLNQGFQVRTAPITIEKHGKMSEIIEKMNINLIHRVWVVDQNKPIGAVTISDIFASLVPASEAEE